ncbi:MAG: AmmeMemoRadiSam system protein B [Candidatus Cloacimonetes bacterium]|nr:AmmeMemoRadiSam system protein B [Candidatus Cloacimonadota bacterium]
MKRIIILALIIAIAMTICSQTLEPVVAGTWYPDNKAELEMMLMNFFQNVENIPTKSDPLGLISPHAGFIYSGQVAAHGYSVLQNKHYDTVILLGSSHHYLEDTISIYNGDFAKTPLGDIPINKMISEELIKADDRFVFNKKIHSSEHSLEVQLPFLQYQLHDFNIVLILTSTNNFQLLDKLADELTRITRDTTSNLLFISSSDMSHFHSYAFANTMDKRTCDLILNEKWDSLKNDILSGKSELCGFHAMYSFLQIMENLQTDNPVLLKYANSGDAVGNTHSDRVVGYCSIIYPKKEETKIKDETMKISEKKFLLNLARQSIQYYLQNHKQLQITKPDNPELLKKRAVFVTLNSKGDLRGCIGHMQPRLPLYEAVIEMAIGAAFEDPRFPIVRNEKELEEIEIEISILSPMERISDYKTIRLGIDGVWVKKGFRSGVFLPQVATETGWDLTTFLGNLCSHKAGLPYNAFKDDETEIFIYQVEKFKEGGLVNQH